MNVSFLAAELGKWDQVEPGWAQALVLPFFADERPLRGAAGLCDWRLCGRLSRLLVGGRVDGHAGEATLLPALRLPFARLVLFGLGASAEFDEAAARRAGRAIVALVGRLAASRYALVPPGRSTGRLSARRALELYLDEAAGGPAEIVVVESPAGQKEAAELARR